MAIKQQNFDYFLVLDFEATCEKDVKLKPQEVIEFPVLKVNGKTFEVESVFHHYVQPRVNPKLTKFCTELTGITQEMVDGKPYMEDVLKMFHDWMSDQGLLKSDAKSVFVTCGDWDLQTMLPQQSEHFHFHYGDYLKKWINIKKAFASVVSPLPPRGDMKEMLQILELKLEGRHHSGIDDVHNIARILKKLAERGGVFAINGQLSSAAS